MFYKAVFLVIALATGEQTGRFESDPVTLEECKEVIPVATIQILETIGKDKFGIQASCELIGQEI